MAGIEFPSHHRSHKNWIFRGGTNRKSPLLSLQLVFTGLKFTFPLKDRDLYWALITTCSFSSWVGKVHFSIAFGFPGYLSKLLLEVFMVCGITLHKHELLLMHHGFEPLRMISRKKIPFWCSSCWKFQLRSLLWRTALCSQQGQTCQGVFLMLWIVSM